MAVLLAIAGLGVVGLVHIILASQIESQNSRNTLLKTEIVKLDEQIKEIDKLREQIAQVLARKQVVETLQATRNESVHLLDQLVRQLPDGIYLRSIRQVGTKITLIGYAQSNARVSTLMRNIQSSPWLDVARARGDQAGAAARRRPRPTAHLRQRGSRQRVHAEHAGQAHGRRRSRSRSSPRPRRQAGAAGTPAKRGPGQAGRRRSHAGTRRGGDAKA